VAAWRLHPPEIGDYLTLSTDARTAKTQADAVLQQRGVVPDSYHHAVIFVANTDPYVNEYLRERIGVARLNEIYASQVPGALWRVRYFRDSQKEEYAAILKPDGTLHSLWLTLPEDAPGAALGKEAAVALGEKYLRDEKHLDLRQWSLVGAESTKRPHRVDHVLVWQKQEALNPEPPGSAGAAQEAHARIRVEILGDEIAKYQTFIKIPDDWIREQKALNVPRLALAYGVPVLVFSGLGLTLIIIFLRNLKSPDAVAIPWRRLAWWSSWMLVGGAVVFTLGDGIPDFLNGYQTDQSLKLQVAQQVILTGIGALFDFAALTLLFGLAWFYARRAFGEDRLPGWLGMPALYYRDAVFIGIGGAAAFVALHRLLDVAFVHWPTMHRQIAASFGSDFDATSPAAAILGSTLVGALFLTGLIAAIAAFVAAYIPQTWLRVLLFLAGVLARVGSNWGNPADYAKQFFTEAILLAVIVLGVRYVMKFNLLGCFLAVFAGAALGGVSELLGQHEAFYRTNGIAVLVAVLALLAWPLLAWLRGSSGTTAA